MTEHFEEFLRERREQADRTRRVLVGVLGVVCVALAVSNVVLALRLTAGRTRPAAEAPAPAASILSLAQGPAPAVTLPTTTEPSRPDSAEPRAAGPPSDEPGHSATPWPATPPRVRDRVDPGRALPPRRSAGTLPARGVSAPPRAPVSALTPASAAPEASTAAWMLTTYGRAEAEARARAAREFYDAESAEGRYWQRVLTEIAAAR